MTAGGGLGFWLIGGLVLLAILSNDE